MPRPRGTNYIVEQNLLITHDAIMMESCNLVELSAAISTNLSTVQWLARRRLIRNSCNCPSCQDLMVLCVYSQGTDEYRWSCSSCHQSKSVRFGSFFTGSHYPLAVLCKMLYMWAYQYPTNLIQHELRIGHSCAIDWMNFIRDVCVKWQNEKAPKLGGFNENLEARIVEIDESAFGKAKYHVGHHAQTRWVVGGVERDGKGCFLEVVKDRSSQTLLALVEKWVEPGSRIMTDAWQGYNGIANIQNGIFTHDVVHSANFVHPANADIHTQNVETFWCKTKRKFKQMHGTSKDLFPSYLSETMFRRYYNDNLFAYIIIEISKPYAF
jgi:transposase-like protein